MNKALMKKTSIFMINIIILTIVFQGLMPINAEVIQKQVGNIRYELTTPGDIIWRGGGKVRHPTGAYFDTKTLTATIRLFEPGWENGIRTYFDTSESAGWDVTAARSTIWGLSLTSSGMLAGGKFYTEPTVRDIARISRGKITAGKKTGKLYLLAFVGYDKFNCSGGNLLTKEIEVRAAATHLQFTATSAGNSKIIRTVSAPLGIPTRVYAEGLYKDGKELKDADEYNFYKISVEPKHTKYVQLGCHNADINKAGDWSNEIYVNHSDLKKGIQINGVSLNENRVTRTVLIMESRISGKKTKLNVNVNNSIVEVSDLSKITDDGVVSVPISSTGEYNSDPKTVVLNDYCRAANSAGLTTDKPRLMMVDEGFLGIGKTATHKDNIGRFINQETNRISVTAQRTTDGKVSFSTLNSVGKITVTFYKKATTPKNYYVVLIYNTNRDKDGNYTGIVTVPIKTVIK